MDQLSLLFGIRIAKFLHLNQLSRLFFQRTDFISIFMKQKLIIVFLLFFTSVHANESEAPRLPERTSYSFFVTIIRFLLSPIRYLTAPRFRLSDIPTQDHLSRFGRVKELDETYKTMHFDIMSLPKQTPIEQLNKLIQESLEKVIEGKNIIAQVNVENQFLSVRHDQLALWEQVFTERQQELHEHLCITCKELHNTTKQLWEVSHNQK